MDITEYNAVSLTIMIRHLRRIIVLTKLHERGEYIKLTQQSNPFYTILCLRLNRNFFIICPNNGHFVLVIVIISNMLKK